MSQLYYCGISKIVFCQSQSKVFLCFFARVFPCECHSGPFFLTLQQKMWNGGNWILVERIQWSTFLAKEDKQLAGGRRIGYNCLKMPDPLVTIIYISSNTASLLWAVTSQGKQDLCQKNLHFFQLLSYCYNGKQLVSSQSFNQCYFLKLTITEALLRASAARSISEGSFNPFEIRVL